MAEKFEHPEGIASPPVVFVTVEHDGGVSTDPILGAQLLESFRVDVIANDGVIREVC